MSGGPVAVLLPRRERFQARGAGAVSWCVAEQARHSGFRERLLVLGSPADPAAGDPLDPELFVPVRPAGWIHGRRSRRYLVGAAGALEGRRPALVEVHNRPGYLPFLARRLPGASRLLYLHNDPQSMAALATPRRRLRALEGLGAVVCVSGHIRRRFLEGLEGHPLQERVRVVLNGVDTRALVPAPKRQEVVFLGRLSPQKGGLLFLEAARLLAPRFPGWRFVVIGSRRFGAGLESAYERRVAAAAAALGPACELTGYLPREEALARLARAAVAVVPSLWDEPCGLVAMEAMSAGCALVTSGRGGLAEVAGEADLRLGGETPQDLAEALGRVLEEAALREALQRRARERAERHLDVRRTAARLDEVRRLAMEGAG